MIRILSKAKLLIGEYICFGQLFFDWLSDDGFSDESKSTMDKLVYYFILGSDNRDCVELGSEENDEAYISTYYTRKEINESFLFEVVQKHEYAYEMCQLQELIIKKQDERWILYLNDEVMGYVEVKKGFLIKEFCFVWDRQKIDQRRQLYE